MQPQLTPFVELPTRFGTFKVAAYRDRHGGEHLVLTCGKVRGKRDVLTRIQSECVTGEVFGSKRCDCRAQLEYALQKIKRTGSGILLYLRQEGRGHGLFEKMRSYKLQDRGLDTVDAARALGLPVDARNYKVAVEILRMLRVRSVRLMTNNPHKIDNLKEQGVSTVRVAVPWSVNQYNKAYLRVKREKMGHL